MGLKKFGIKIAWDVINGLVDNRSDREKVCGTKDMLEHRAAESRALSLERKHKEPFDAYECPYCHRWHVGHSRHHFTLREKYGENYKL
jgi:hypothetical protein